MFWWENIRICFENEKSLYLRDTEAILKMKIWGNLQDIDGWECIYADTYVIGEPNSDIFDVPKECNKICPNTPNMTRYQLMNHWGNAYGKKRFVENEFKLHI